MSLSGKKEKKKKKIVLGGNRNQISAEFWDDPLGLFLF